MADDAANPPPNHPAGYVPPKVWAWNKESGGRFANINRPTAGAREDRELPVGSHPFQLYSLATPNGVNVADVVATNAARAGCDAVPTIDQRHPTVRVDTYQGCGTHRVEYWQMQGNGHTWAGTPGILDLFVGTTNTDFSATTAVLDFFDGTTV